jgi:hypothetical protein
LARGSIQLQFSTVQTSF